MSFLAPIALAGLAFLPVVLAMYLLKLRRDERIVPSTLLWQRLLTDVEANAPWQRLRFSWLLLVQLLVATLIVLHILSPDELDPALEGDLRLVDSETGEGIDVTVDLATLDDYKARLAAWQDGFADLAARRGATYVPISTDVALADLVFAELRRRRVVG